MGVLQTCARRWRRLAGAELEICPRRQRLTTMRRLPCAHFPPLRAMIGSERPSEFRDAPFGQSRGDVVCCVCWWEGGTKGQKRKKEKITLAVGMEERTSKATREKGGGRCRFFGLGRTCEVRWDAKQKRAARETGLGEGPRLLVSEVGTDDHGVVCEREKKSSQSPRSIRRMDEREGREGKGDAPRS